MKNPRDIPLADAAPSGTRRLVSDTGAMAGGAAASQLITVVGGLVLARVLGLDGYGPWKTVQLAIGYTAFANLGATYGLTRLCPSVLGRGREDQYQRMMAASLGLSTLIGLALAVSFGVLAWTAQDVTARICFSALAVLAVLQPVFQHGETALIVEKSFGLLARLNLAATAVRVGLCIALALAFGLPGALVGFVVVFAGLALAFYRHSRARLALAPPGDLWGRTVRVGFPITALAAAEMFAQTADKWVVVGVLGPQSMSLYQMAIFPVAFLLLIPLNLRQVVSVDIYDKFGSTGDLGSCREVFGKSVWVIALGTPWLLGGAYFGMPWLIDWLLPDYRPAIPVAQFHALAMYPFLIVQTSLAVMIVANRHWVAGGWITGATVVAAVAAAGVAVPVRETWGETAALSTVLGLHAVAWLALGAAGLVYGQRLAGTGRREARKQALRWLSPMALAIIAAITCETLVNALGVRRYSLGWALAGGALYTLACLPLLVGLERRTGGLTFLAGKVLDRVAPWRRRGD